MNSKRVFKSSNSLLLELFKVGISNVQPRKILKKFLKVLDQEIVVLDKNNKNIYKNIKSIIPICVGKASVDMAKSAMSILKDHKNKISEGILVVNEENFKEIPGFKCFMSGHPVPNRNGLIASKFIESKLKKLGQKDLVLFFLSGGGSALMPYPAGEIKLSEKIKINQSLLSSGANIIEINTVRKHLSKIKGGNFLKMSFPSQVHSFILSDVVGDDLSSISSGPTVPDETTFEDVQNILKKYDIWNEVSPSIKSYIQIGQRDSNLETPDKKSVLFSSVKNTLIGSNYLCLKSIDEYCKSKNILSKLWKYNIEGDVKDIVKSFIKDLKVFNYSKPIVLISGGESTVKIKGNGKGGRNQELALHFIKQVNDYLPNLKFTLLSAGTDGRDGPTNAAGAIVNEKSIELINKNDINLENELKNNNSYEVLKKINSLVIINGTNTNVADLQLLIIN